MRKLACSFKDEEIQRFPLSPFDASFSPSTLPFPCKAIIMNPCRISFVPNQLFFFSDRWHIFDNFLFILYSKDKLRPTRHWKLKLVGKWELRLPYFHWKPIVPMRGHCFPSEGIASHWRPTGPIGGRWVLLEESSSKRNKHPPWQGRAGLAIYNQS